MKRTRKLISPYATRNIPVIPNAFGRARLIISVILIIYLKYPSRRISRPNKSSFAKKKLKLLLRYSASRNNKSSLIRKNKK
jgi:hypothetical protein